MVPIKRKRSHLMGGVYCKSTVLPKPERHGLSSVTGGASPQPVTSLLHCARNSCWAVIGSHVFNAIRAPRISPLLIPMTIQLRRRMAQSYQTVGRRAAMGLTSCPATVRKDNFAGAS